MKKKLIAAITLIILPHFDIASSAKSDLTKSIENLHKTTDDCIKTIDTTIATAERTTQSIQNLIDALEKNRTTNYNQSYKKNELQK